MFVHELLMKTIAGQIFYPVNPVNPVKINLYLIELCASLRLCVNSLSKQPKRYVNLRILMI